jgi:cell division protein ZapE
MLMDLFFEASPVVRKRRAHFHEFMLDVHERIMHSARR